MNEREALEKIAKYKNKSCQGCGADEYSMLRARIGVLTETIKALKGIATQALASQEDNGLYIPQETAQNEFFLAECTGGETDTPQEPQEKTFTLEEIKRILKNLHKKEFYDCGECTECLLAEFEKDVE